MSPQRAPTGPTARAPRSYKISTTDDMDGLICESLLLGDVEAAVELCVEDARWADAIILAMTGGSELLARTQHRYLQACTICERIQEKLKISSCSKQTKKQIFQVFTP